MKNKNKIEYYLLLSKIKNCSELEVFYFKNTMKNMFSN